MPHPHRLLHYTRDRMPAGRVVLSGVTRTRVALGVIVALSVANPHARGAEGPAPSSFSIRTWTTSNGLPNGTINSMVETEDGYFWLATSPVLLRFDGREFTTVDAAQLPPLANRQVRALAKARDGGMWIGTPDGVIFRTDGRRVLESLPPPPGVRFMTRIVPGRPGELWAASASDVYHYRDGTWTSLAKEGNSAVDWVALEGSPDGVLWVGSHAGLFRSSGGRLESVPSAILPPSAVIRALFQDKSRQLWISSADGLRVYSTETARVRRVRVTPAIDPADALVQANDGAIWVANGRGVFVLGPLREDGADFACTSMAIDAGPASYRIPQLLLSHSGAIVARTEGAGLRVISQQPFRVFGAKDGLPALPVHHVAADGRDGAWIGAGCGGLTHRAEDGTFETVHAPSLGLRNDCVRALMLDRNDGMWVGQGRGSLTRLGRDGATRSWGPEHGLPDVDIGPLLEDRRGVVWVGTQSGTLCAVEGAGPPRCPALGITLPPDKVWSMTEDSTGALWIGQVGRVTRVANGQATTIDAGLPDGPIRALRAEPDGTVWMASFGGGLARWRRGEIARVSTAQDLFDNALSTFLPDRLGHIWLLGNAGVLQAHRDVLDAVADGLRPDVEGVLFGPTDGVPEGNGGHPNGFVDTRGHVLLATVGGLAVFDSRARSSAARQEVLLETVTDRGRTLTLDDHAAATVAPGGGPVEFRFAAPNVAHPEKVVVRYRLEGRDAGWVRARSAFARYTALDPGRYRLHLAVRNAAGEWSDPLVAATLDVLPFWWQSWWARTVAALLAVLALSVVVQLRLRSVKRRNRALATEITERIRAEELAHRQLLELAHVSRLATAGELTATLTHELGQPLTAIAVTAEASRLMLAANADPKDLDAALVEIAQQGQRAAQVVRGLRAFLRRDLSETAALDLNAEVREVVRLAQSTLNAAGTSIVLDLAGDPLTAYGDRIPLQQVVLNLVLNAVEAIRAADATIRVVHIRTSRMRSGGARLSVADSGPGIPPAERARVFERFHSTKSEGMGIGLSICRSIVEAHGGRIQVRNLRGVGAVFSFTLPARTMSAATGSVAAASVPSPEQAPGRSFTAH